MLPELARGWIPVGSSHRRRRSCPRPLRARTRISQRILGRISMARILVHPMTASVRHTPPITSAACTSTHILSQQVAGVIAEVSGGESHEQERCMVIREERPWSRCNDRVGHLPTTLHVKIDEYLGKPAGTGRPSRPADAELLQTSRRSCPGCDRMPSGCGPRPVISRTPPGTSRQFRSPRCGFRTPNAGARMISSCFSRMDNG